MRRIGVLMAGDEDDPRVSVSAFIQVLGGLGWIDGRNVRMDLRWGGGDTNRMQAFAQELVGLQPDIVVTGSIPATAAVQRETRTIPIVFAGVGDPVARGLVPNLNHPGGNITGFALYEPTMGGKWLELLSEIAPGLKRAASIPTTPARPFMCPHLRRRPGHSRSCQSWRPCMTKQRSNRPSGRPLGANR